MVTRARAQAGNDIIEGAFVSWYLSAQLPTPTLASVSTGTNSCNNTNTTCTCKTLIQVLLLMRALEGTGSPHSVHKRKGASAFGRLKALGRAETRLPAEGSS